MTAPDERSVLLAALGDDADRLRPECRDYAAGPGDGVVVGEGVFAAAGSRFGRLWLLARPFVGPRLLVTAFGRDVPFRVVNRVFDGPDGVVELHARRTFRFARGDQVFVDLLRAGDSPGTLLNLLGDARRIELVLRVGVTADGRLSLRSERARLRLGRLRIPLPRPLSLRVGVTDGFDEASGWQTVRARAANPLIGTVLEYRGSFRWRRGPVQRGPGPENSG